MFPTHEHELHGHCLSGPMDVQSTLEELLEYLLPNESVNGSIHPGCTLSVCRAAYSSSSHTAQLAKEAVLLLLLTTMLPVLVMLKTPTTTHTLHKF